MYDKTGLPGFSRELCAMGCELVSTGGTLHMLEESGLSVTSVAEVTGFPEILGGRVKTLHPLIHGGLLANQALPAHLEEAERFGIKLFDLVVNNLYPFRETVENEGSTRDDAIENIDIGGPAMIRAASKNFLHVLPIVDPADYPDALAILRSQTTDIRKRRRLASKAFRYVSEYDATISSYFASGDEGSLSGTTVPSRFHGSWRLVAEPRYGENPHQKAGIYASEGETGGMAKARQLHGVPLSYLNYMDADAAVRVVSAFKQHAVAIVKHANPCGLAVRGDQAEAFRMALSGDPVSAFGGIVGFNSTVSGSAARAMEGTLFDVIVAPEFEPGALEIFRKRKRTRVLKVSPVTCHHNFEIRTLSGGVVLQEPDNVLAEPDKWHLVTERSPSDVELRDMEFAANVCRFVHSNAIVVANNNVLLGMGAGQPNRVTSVRLALETAGAETVGAALASDAFFPFEDSIEVAAKAGISTVVQPGGSVNDSMVIEAANRLGVTMVFTGIRQFLH